MSSAGFLLIAVAGSVALSLLVWLFNRKPKTFMSSIDDFSREMKALGHDADEPHGSRFRRRTAQPRRSSRPTAIDPSLRVPPATAPRRDGTFGPVGSRDSSDPEERRP